MKKSLLMLTLLVSGLSYAEVDVPTISRVEGVVAEKLYKNLETRTDVRRTMRCTTGIPATCSTEVSMIGEIGDITYECSESEFVGQMLYTCYLQ